MRYTNINNRYKLSPLKLFFRKIRKTIGYKNYRRIQIGLYLLILSIVIILFIPSTKVSADEGTDKVYYQYYQSITIKSGDTLWSIANKYKHNESCKEYINEIKKINHLKTDKICEGDTIVIVYYSDEYNL